MFITAGNRRLKRYRKWVSNWSNYTKELRDSGVR